MSNVNGSEVNGIDTPLSTENRFDNNTSPLKTKLSPKNTSDYHQFADRCSTQRGTNDQRVTFMQTEHDENQSIKANLER